MVVETDRKEDNMTKEGMIPHPLHFGRPYPVQTVLRDLASQEGCDGEPWDQMMEAAAALDALQALRNAYPILREIVHQAYHVAEGSEERMDVGEIVADTDDYRALEEAMDATGHGDVHEYLQELDALLGVDDQEAKGE